MYARTCMLGHVWLCNPIDCSLTGSSLYGISRQNYWSGLPVPSPGDLPDPGIEPMSPALAGRFFIVEPPGKPHRSLYICPNPHNVQSQEWTQMWTADFGWWPVNAGSSVVTNVQLVGVVESGGDCTCRGMGRKYVEYLCTSPSISLWT